MATTKWVQSDESLGLNGPTWPIRIAQKKTKKKKCGGKIGRKAITLATIEVAAVKFMARTSQEQEFASLNRKRETQR